MDFSCRKKAVLSLKQALSQALAAVFLELKDLAHLIEIQQV
jgi:hypothetical protein